MIFKALGIYEIKCKIKIKIQYQKSKFCVTGFLKGEENLKIKIR